MYPRTNIPRKDTEFESGVKPYLVDDDYETMMETYTASEVESLVPYAESETQPSYLEDVPYEAIEYAWPHGLTIPDFSVPWPEIKPVDADGSAAADLCCFAMVDGCYAPGETREIIISAANCPSAMMADRQYAAWRFVGASLTFPNTDGGTYAISDASGGVGWGKFSVTAAEDAWKSLPVTIHLVTAVGPWNEDHDIAAGIACTPGVLVPKCECECPDGIEWDDGASAETVARNNSCIVAIVADIGCGPFTWSVGGTDFTLASETTAGLSNTLIAGPGACGTATITVTGCDGTSVTGYVRCTTGAWYPTVLNMGCTSNCIGSTYAGELIFGKTKQTGDFCTDKWDGARCPTTDCADCSCHNCSNYCTSMPETVAGITRTCTDLCQAGNWCQTHFYNICKYYQEFEWRC